MPNIISVIFILLFISSCSSPTSTTIIGPDGTQNNLIACEETKQCYQKAREVCGGTYKIINTNTEASGVSGITMSEISMLIKCDN